MCPNKEAKRAISSDDLAARLTPCILHSRDPHQQLKALHRKLVWGLRTDFVSGGEPALALHNRQRLQYVNLDELVVQVWQVTPSERLCNLAPEFRKQLDKGLAPFLAQSLPLPQHAKQELEYTCTSHHHTTQHA